MEDETAFTDELTSAMEYYETSYELFAKIEHHERKAKEGFERDKKEAALQQHTTIQKTGKTKLPKLELAKFCGDPLKWQELWDQFKTTISSNESIYIGALYSPCLG